MGEENRSLLVVAVPPALFARCPPFLWRTSFDVSTPADAALAVRAVAQTRFTLILVGYPLPNMQLPDFVDAVRGFGSPCRGSGLLVLARRDRLDEALPLVGRGVNRVVSQDAGDEEIAAAVAALLEVAPRVAARVAVSVMTTIERRERRTLLTQTLNLSRSGMLVAAGPGAFRVGDRLRFQLGLAGAAVTGTCEVVRVAQSRLDGGPGVGVRFVELEGASAGVLERALAAAAAGTT